MAGVFDPATGEMIQDELGREVPDSMPMEVPLGMKRPESLAEQVQRLVRNSVSAYAEIHGQETFAEADDLELDDEFDPYTPYETQFDPVLGRDLTPADFLDADRRQAIREEYLELERNRIRSEERQDAIDEVYKKSRRLKREAAEGAAPSSSQAKPAPAEPQTGG